ncbi:hypothetical protein ACIQB4_28225 [Streptomyces griseoluteus]|uniref:hypothetical protein n=1 Tax=Streptomyces griseoluteus TaxID=29306 RepID=UPI003821D01A
MDRVEVFVNSDLAGAGAVFDEVAAKGAQAVPRLGQNVGPPPAREGAERSSDAEPLQDHGAGQFHEGLAWDQ